MKKRYLRHIPKPLLDDLVEGRWLPVVGAGLSRNAHIPAGRKMPLWNELGEQLAGEMRDYAYSSPLDAISAYEHEFGRPKLIEKLAEALLIGETRPGEVHRAFCSVPFDLVCTTNFDYLIERQYDLIPRPCTPLIEEDQLSINIRGSSVALLKIHGDLNHPNRLVATEEDYDAFLERFPLVSTFLANLLITRTAIFIGYSLDDPDFRQIWQVVGERLGRARRTAYALMVGAGAADIARFDRRGVKVINLPGGRPKYPEILTHLFDELREYWRDNVVGASQVTEEGPLRELSLPRDAATRLCFFAIPLSLQPFYRDRVFPLVRDKGLVPVTADDVVSPGESFLAKIDTLIERAFLVVVDATTEFTWSEARMALSRGNAERVVVIIDEKTRIPFDLQIVRLIRRPDLTSVELQPFLEEFRALLEQAVMQYEPRLSSEPQRLFEAREYRAAVISAISLLEAMLRENLDIPAPHKRKVVSLRQMLETARGRGLLSKYHVSQVMDWLQVRNEVVHTHAAVSAKRAREIVNGVREIVGQL